MRRTHVWNLVFLAVVAAALVLPRFLTHGEGFAAGAEAVMMFLALLALAVVVAAGQAVDTWVRRRSLASHELWLGFAPLVVGAVGLAALILFLRL